MKASCANCLKSEECDIFRAIWSAGDVDAVICEDYSGDAIPPQVELAMAKPLEWADTEHLSIAVLLQNKKDQNEVSFIAEYSWDGGSDDGYRPYEWFLSLHVDGSEGDGVFICRRNTREEIKAAAYEWLSTLHKAIGGAK